VLFFMSQTRLQMVPVSSSQLHCQSSPGLMPVHALPLTHLRLLLRF